ncbi:MAG: LPS export ABC transporter permease LptF [Desulfovibrio sp.]|nr:MAG: LPS export ABC transporter permease LptF [Desulfovibrio sp.]
MFKEIFFLFSLCLGSLVCLIVIGRFLQLRDLLLGLDISFLDLLLLFFYMSPFFLLLLLPVSCMLGVFLTLLRMSTDRELVALKSAGISLYRLIPAPLIFCILCTAATMFISFYGLSWGIDHFRARVVDLARTKTQLVLQPGVFNKQFPGLMVYARQVDNSRGLLEHVIVEDQTRDTATATILAARGAISTDSDQGVIMIVLEDGHVYRQEQDRISVASFERYQVRLNLSNLLRGFELFDLFDAQPRELSLNALRELMQHPELMEHYHYDLKDYRKIRVEIQKRWALPAACLVLGLIAVPLACAFEGFDRKYGVFFALAIFLIYYSFLSFGISLGETESLDPRVGLWLPNVALALLGVIGFRQVAREKSFRIVDLARNLKWPLWRRA